ncbi:MAG: glycosyltransferase family 25 protein [Candidatus Puniceispirillaceae bacterium]
MTSDVTPASISTSISASIPASIPAFTIAFAEADERRQLMAERLGALGLRPHFIDAVRGAEIEANEKARLVSPRRRYHAAGPFQDNALGCALSHHKAWQALIDSGADYGLVFEDDALGLIEKAEMAEILARLIEKADRLDFVFLATRRQNRPRHKLAPLTRKTHLSLLEYHDFGSEAYFLTRKAAMKMLAHPEKQMFEIDCLMHHWWRHDCAILHLDPPAFEEDGRTTTIGYSQKHSWPDDQIITKLLRRWNRARDSLTKRRQFPRYKAALKAKLMAKLMDDVS